MKKAEKYQDAQMYQLYAGERSWGSPSVQWSDVYASVGSRVSTEWLSGCKESRALTSNLMERVSDPLTLVAALQQVVKNGGSAGIDGMDTQSLRGCFWSQMNAMVSNLRSGSYHPKPVIQVEIPKPFGGHRLLGIPTVKDRLVQQAISLELSKHYEPIFSSSSYGFRPYRGAHAALKRAGQYIAEGRDWIVDLDLEKFFDAVNHDRLLWLLGHRIGDKTLLNLIGRFLRTGILSGGLVTQRVSGTPQGSPLSPLLSNIVLDELDKELERRGHRFVRYADDLIIMVKSEASAERVMSSITEFIEKRLKLKVNRIKSKICRPYQLNFLGHSLLKDGSFGLSKQSERRFKTKLKEVTKRNRGISLEQLVREINPKLRGWLNYFGYARMSKQLQRIESWLNRRIRCFRLKQCKRAVSIARFLHKLGVPWNRCWSTAGSSKGWFRLSASHAVHEGMNNQWMRRIGLISLTDYYKFKSLKKPPSTRDVRWVV